jgi:predicted secreted protein
VTAEPFARPSSGRRRPLGALIGAVGVVLVLVGAGACSGKESPASTASTLGDDANSQVTAPPVAFFTETQADPTGPITVNVGQQFAIVLLAEPATGYSWQPVAPADSTVLLTVGTEFRGPGEAYPDSPETQILRYVGRAVGTAKIALHYSRPAAAAPDDKTVTFTVNVIDPNAPTTTVPPPDTGSTDTTSTTVSRSTTTTRARSTTTTRPRSTTTTRATTTPTT